MPNNVLFDRVKMSVSGTPGTGTITLGSAASGYRSFADAGVANGDVVSYLIEDGSSWEFGKGAYTSSGTTLSRATVVASSAGGTSKISATSAAVVYITALSSDLVQVASDGSVSIGAPPVYTFTPLVLTVGGSLSGKDGLVRCVYDNDFSGVSVGTHKGTTLANDAQYIESTDSAGGYTWFVGVDATGWGNSGLVIDAAPSLPTIFSHDGTENMRLDTNGNILIGTTTAGASKLVVNDSSIQVNTSKTPASASATGTTGQIAWDSSYIYVCVGPSQWKRAALSSW